MITINSSDWPSRNWRRRQASKSWDISTLFWRAASLRFASRRCPCEQPHRFLCYYLFFWHAAPRRSNKIALRAQVPGARYCTRRWAGPTPLCSRTAKLSTIPIYTVFFNCPYNCPWSNRRRNTVLEQSFHRQGFSTGAVVYTVLQRRCLSIIIWHLNA